MTTIDEAIALYYEKVNGKLRLKREYTDDWRKQIPKGSRWSPGSPGDPACPECEGTGGLKLDLPVGHPAFGEIFDCSCVDRRKKRSR